jgi:predicted alpha/beta-hydrolase family hydrolase
VTPTGSQWRVATENGETSVAWDPATSGFRKAIFICGHGAGGHMGDRALAGLSAALSPRGIDVVRFNFLYRERGSASPDPMPRLLKCFSAVVASVREELRPDLLVIGGRSMGGRAASVLAAEGHPCHGVLLFAYPLHPPGRPEKLRDAHLSSIKVPVLCFNGTRDDFCRRDLMEAAVAPIGKRWTMHWLEGADHSFRVPKRSGKTDEDVLAEVADITEDWTSRLSGQLLNG